MNEECVSRTSRINESLSSIIHSIVNIYRTGTSTYHHYHYLSLFIHHPSSIFDLRALHTTQVGVAMDAGGATQSRQNTQFAVFLPTVERLTKYSCCLSNNSLSIVPRRVLLLFR